MTTIVRVLLANLVSWRLGSRKCDKYSQDDYTVELLEGAIGKLSGGARQGQFIGKINSQNWYDFFLYNLHRVITWLTQLIIIA